jgi:hypothetical protein
MDKVQEPSNSEFCEVRLPFAKDCGETGSLIFNTWCKFAMLKKDGVVPLRYSRDYLFCVGVSVQRRSDCH